MVKVGIIRCAGTHQEYPGTGCFKTTRGTGGKFSEYSDQDIEIIDMADYGDCPGRDAARVAANMVKTGAYVIYPATRAIMDRTGVKVVMGTHSGSRERLPLRCDNLPIYSVYTVF